MQRTDLKLINTCIYKRLLFLAVAVTILSLGSSAQKQDETIRHIIEKHADASGMNAREKSETLISYGVIEQLGTELQITILQKRPDLYRMDVHFEEGRITQAYDGINGWVLNPFLSSDTVSITGLELEQLKESAIFDGVLTNADDLGYKIDYLGEDNIVTNPSHVLLLKKENGNRLKFFIDKKDFLIKRTEASLFIDGFYYEVNSVFSNFNTVDGMTLPFLIENNNGQLQTKIRIQQIKVNEPLDDDFFQQRNP